MVSTIPLRMTQLAIVALLSCMLSKVAVGVATTDCTTASNGDPCIVSACSANTSYCFRGSCVEVLEPAGSPCGPDLLSECTAAGDCVVLETTLPTSTQSSIITTSAAPTTFVPLILSVGKPTDTQAVVDVTLIFTTTTLRGFFLSEKQASLVLQYVRQNVSAIVFSVVSSSGSSSYAPSDQITIRIEVSGAEAALQSTETDVLGLVRADAFLADMQGLLNTPQQKLAQVRVVDTVMYTPGASSTEATSGASSTAVAVISVVAALVVVAVVLAVYYVRRSTWKAAAELSPAMTITEAKVDRNTLPPVTADIISHQTFSTFVGLPKDMTPIEISTTGSNGFDNFTVAFKSYNTFKNRTKAVVPYDRSRVPLQPQALVPGSDYINASFVRGYHHPREYICAQGPLEETVEDFWRMVWEQHVTLIVCLCPEVEDGKEQFAQYWSNNGDIVEHGTIHVLHEDMEQGDGFVIRHFLLRNINMNATRHVVQLQYLHWPVASSPSPESYSAFCQIEAELQGEAKGPILVHCSDGAGRTGTHVFIASELHKFASEKSVDFKRRLLQLRTDRQCMVSTVEQYSFATSFVLGKIAELDTTPALGCTTEARKLFLSFQRGNMDPTFHLADQGRRILYVTTVLAAATNRGFMHAFMILCTDVLVLTCPSSNGHVLLCKPMDRQELSVDEMQTLWEDERVLLQHGGQRVVVQFMSATEKAFWVEALESMFMYREPGSLNGPSVLCTAPRSVDDVAALLDTINPQSSEGFFKLQKEFNHVPKTIENGVVQRQDFSHQQLSITQPLLDSDGYLISEPVLPTLSAEALTALSVAAEKAEREEDIARDMVEIEYLVKVIELDEAQTAAQAKFAHAREAEIAAHIAQQKAIIDAHIQATKTVEDSTLLEETSAVSTAASEGESTFDTRSLYAASEYTVYTEAASTDFVVSDEDEEVDGSHDSGHLASYANATSGQEYNLDELEDTSAAMGQLMAMTQSLLGTVAEEDGGATQRRDSLLSAPKQAAGRRKSTQVGGALAKLARRVSTGGEASLDDRAIPTQAAGDEKHAHHLPPQTKGAGRRRSSIAPPRARRDTIVVDGKEKVVKKIPVKSTIGGFALAKGAARRLARAAYDKRDKPEEEAGAEPIKDDKCTFLGDCSCSQCTGSSV
eukprot:m.309185 g.309185  ORF g.309185 m.309185 type:complete len:1148 (+) comp15945_c1_seq1:266-3709(+)